MIHKRRREKTEPSRRCTRMGEKPWEISLGILEDEPTEHIGSESEVAWAESDTGISGYTAFIIIIAVRSY